MAREGHEAKTNTAVEGGMAEARLKTPGGHTTRARGWGGFTGAPVQMAAGVRRSRADQGHVSFTAKLTYTGEYGAFFEKPVQHLGLSVYAGDPAGRFVAGFLTSGKFGSGSGMASHIHVIRSDAEGNSKSNVAGQEMCDEAAVSFTWTSNENARSWPRGRSP